MSLRTCSSAETSTSGSGAAMPARKDSVPIMCDTAALTSQPGSGLGARHWVSDKPASSASMSSQTAKRPVSTADLSSLVTGRSAMVTDRRPLYLPIESPMRIMTRAPIARKPPMAIIPAGHGQTVTQTPAATAAIAWATRTAKKG